ALLEIDRDGLLAADAAHQLPALDDLQIVEANLMAGTDDEAIIGLVRRPHQDGAEPLLLGPPLGGEELYLIEPLLIESDRSARAEYLDGDAPLAAPRASIDVDDAG